MQPQLETSSYNNCASDKPLLASPNAPSLQSASPSKLVKLAWAAPYRYKLAQLQMSLFQIVSIIPPQHRKEHLCSLSQTKGLTYRLISS